MWRSNSSTEQGLHTRWLFRHYQDIRKQATVIDPERSDLRLCELQSVYILLSTNSFCLAMCQNFKHHHHHHHHQFNVNFLPR